MDNFTLIRLLSLVLAVVVYPCVLLGGLYILVRVVRRAWR